MYSAFERMDTPYCASDVLCPLYGKALYKYYDDRIEGGNIRGKAFASAC